MSALFGDRRVRPEGIMKLSKPEDMDDLGAEGGETESGGVESGGPVMVMDPVSQEEVPVSEALESLYEQLYAEVNNVTAQIEELEQRVEE